MQQALFGGVDVLAQGSMEQKGERAKLANVIGGIAVSDLVKTTLGPKGQDKILQTMPNQETGAPRTMSVTNDGATILKSVHMDNPAGKVLVEISKTQDDEVGDGTTSVAVLAGELLRCGEKLLDESLHPQTIVEGWRMAANEASRVLLESCQDHKDDQEQFQKDLMEVARTTLSSKILSNHMEHFAELAVQSVLRLKGSTNLDSIHIIKKLGGTIKDSFLAEGFLLDKKIGQGQPQRLENPKILVANTALDTDKIKIYGARVKVDSLSKLAGLEKAEKDKMRQKCKKITDIGVNCFINRQLIYNFPEELFAQAGVMAIEHADFDGIERLALALGAEVTSTFDEPAGIPLGTCKLIDQIMIGEDQLIRFSGCKAGEACTVVLRGSTRHMLDEAERSLHDALCVISQMVKDTRIVLGAGCSEMLMAKAVDDLAQRTPGKKAMAIHAFASALRQLPSIIATNAGLDASELVANLKAEHYKGNSTFGIDIVNGTIGDVRQMKITESYKVKSSVVKYAAEAAELLMRVDDIIHCAPRQRTR